MDKGHEMTLAERDRAETINRIAATPTITNAIKTIKPAELLQVTSIPCARTSLLYGILGGIIIGSTKFFLTRSGRTGMNWGIGVFSGISLVSFEGCRFQRYQERSRMKYAVDRVEIRRREKEE